MKPVDLAIVGGGPAGLATSIAASRVGLQVAVFDGRKPPIDKTCGEGLLPSALAALSDLGIAIDSHLGIPFTGIRFTDKKSSAYAPILGGAGLGLRRRDLHRVLIERAEACGVSLFWSARISDMQRDGVWVDGAFHPCSWLVGADGQQSAVRKFAGLEPRKRASLRFGFRQHFSTVPWSNAVEVHWGQRVELIVTPTGREEICIVVLTSDPHVRVEEAIDQFPEIAERLRGAAVVSRESGASTHLCRARAVVRGNVALVGDASCAMDGISGSGLSLAFQEALALADALACEDLAVYERTHARITKVPVRVTRLLLMMGSSAFLRRAALGFLARNPALFSRLIALHVGRAISGNRRLQVGRFGVCYTESKL
ncbi:MAG: NAD(P)/FAD-dependent oxidoreductase [Candidatus Acidiferrales bacterium]